MAKIDTYATPNRIYRYRSISVGKIAQELEAIKEKYVFCSSIDDLNDPMEGTHRVSAFFLNKPDSHKKYDQIKEARLKLGIASFSEAYKHEPMWAHYTNQFQGICVAYVFNNLLSELDDEISLVRMNYGDSAPILRWGRGTVDQNARLTLSTKTSRWAYEREWRVISPTKGKLNYKSHSCIACVYLGSRIDPSNKKLILDEVKALNIEIAAMKLDKYEITFETLYTPIKNTTNKKGPGKQE
jgi:hypothetical protein